MTAPGYEIRRATIPPAVTDALARTLHFASASASATSATTPEPISRR